MKRKLIFILIFSLFSLNCFAYSEYSNPLKKFCRGIVNGALGIVEVLRQMIETNKTEGDIAGFFWGLFKGMGYFLGRTLIGIYDTGTFLLPPYDKVVFEPEFVL